MGCEIFSQHIRFEIGRGIELGFGMIVDVVTSLLKWLSCFCMRFLQIRRLSGIIISEIECGGQLNLECAVSLRFY